jgi:hypothetical protein
VRQSLKKGRVCQFCKVLLTQFDMHLFSFGRILTLLDVRTQGTLTASLRTRSFGSMMDLHVLYCGSLSSLHSSC